MRPLAVLFIGNSYTWANRLPWLTAALAAGLSGRSRLEAAARIQGGVSLEWHFRNPETFRALDSRQWDVVALQDHSLQAVERRHLMEEYAARLHGEVRIRGGHTLFYMTWARQHRPETQDVIAEAYVAIARRLAAAVAPVGEAWRRSLRLRPDLALHVADRSHPTPAGSYLAACVFAASLLQESPEGAPAEFIHEGASSVRLDEQDAAHLQRIAWETWSALDPDLRLPPTHESA